VFCFTLTLPSARTSVDNKEYEYKDGKKRAAHRQQTGKRRETVVCGDATWAAALRHAVERTAACYKVSTIFL
jgi:hypothetical protein